MSNPLTGSQNIKAIFHIHGSARYILVLSFIVIHMLVLMIMRSRAIFAYIMSPMTLKSNQFIGSARYIHVLSLMVICLSVLMTMRSQAIFAYIMSPMTFDLWPHNLQVESVHWLCKMHTWTKFSHNSSIDSWDNAITSIFCIHNEPCDLVTPKSYQFIGSARYITQVWWESINRFLK